MSDTYDVSHEVLESVIFTEQHVEKTEDFMKEHESDSNLSSSST